MVGVVGVVTGADELLLDVGAGEPLAVEEGVTGADPPEAVPGKLATVAYVVLETTVRQVTDFGRL